MSNITLNAIEPGYRWLAVDEILRPSDEWITDAGDWLKTVCPGDSVDKARMYRRYSESFEYDGITHTWTTSIGKVTKTITAKSKPPLGLTPRNIWIETCKSARKSEVVDAIHRYLDAQVDVPAAWLEELIELTK